MEWGIYVLIGGVVAIIIGAVVYFVFKNRNKQVNANPKAELVFADVRSAPNPGDN